MKVTPSYIKILFVLALMAASSLGLAREQCEVAFGGVRDFDPQYVSVIAADDYVTGRGLEDVLKYTQYESDDNTTRTLLDDFNDLKDGDHVMDSGAGKGYVVADLFKAMKLGNVITKTAVYEVHKKSLNVTALAFVQPEEWRTVALKVIEANRGPRDQVRYIKDRFLEQVPDEELSSYGPIKLLLDSAGPMTFSDRPDLVLQKYLDNLDRDGAIHLFLGTVDPRDPRTLPGGTKPDGYAFASRVLVPDGRSMTLMDWLKSIPGIRVQFPRNGVRNLRITKTRDDVRVPRLKILEYDDGTPPYRELVSVAP